MSKKVVAIIGGAGFVGSRLTNRLEKARVSFATYDINVSDKNGRTTYLNVEDIRSLDKLSCASTIINLAAVHHDDVFPRSRYDDVNIQGAKNVCQAACKFGVKKIIFLSSVAIYGFAPPNTDESGESNYFNDYGRTKYLAEQVYKEWHSQDPEGRTLVIVRPTVIFGEGNRGNVYNLLRQLASKKFLMIGDGKNKKSMAYVENVAAFIEFCLKFKTGLYVYNYVDKPDLDMNTFVSQVKEILFCQSTVGIRLPGFLGLLLGYLADLVSFLCGKSLPVSSIRIKKFMGTTQFASSIDDTDFVAPLSLQDGLIRTICYEFKQNDSDACSFETD